MGVRNGTKNKKKVKGVIFIKFKKKNALELLSPEDITMISFVLSLYVDDVERLSSHCSSIKDVDFLFRIFPKFEKLRDKFKLLEKEIENGCIK